MAEPVCVQCGLVCRGAASSGLCGHCGGQAIIASDGVARPVSIDAGAARAADRMPSILRDYPCHFWRVFWLNLLGMGGLIAFLTLLFLLS